jgi:glyoxylase-like metal-dependent hydrolase (beta-lactamase superfamily II)
MPDTQVDFQAGAPVAGTFEVDWIHGSRARRHNTDPPIQVHAYDPHTFVLRQNKATHFEAPFLYLFCGNDRALLLDTGAIADHDRFPLRATVDSLLDGWLSDHPRDRYELIVAHTHGHSDHVAGDDQFADRPATTVVPADLDSVRSFFALTDWPAQTASLDLGGRILEMTGIPGHHDASVAVYDPWTGFLVTGDTVCRGRLYVNDFAAFRDSLDRLVAMCGSRPVTHVMGCHIEMRRAPGRDYPAGETYQPDEPPLQMSVDQLRAVRDAAALVADRPGVHVFDDFVIFHGRCRGAVPRYLARYAWSRIRSGLAGLRPRRT